MCLRMKTQEMRSVTDDLQGPWAQPWHTCWGGCGGGALQVPGDTPVKAIKFAITEPSSGSEASGPLHAGVPHMPWAWQAGN